MELPEFVKLVFK